MNTRILRSSLVATVFAATTLGVGGCKLDVENPNAPDINRALSDPAGLEQLLGGAFQTWVGTRNNYLSTIPLNTMADSYTASWNNAASRFYSSVGSDCAQRCAWNNSSTASETAGGPTVEAQWYGFYTVLSAANDVLAAVADGVCFDGDFLPEDCTANNTFTSRNTAIAKMLQGMALAGIALNYDQGFLIDENTVLQPDPLAATRALPFSTRAEIRDAALARFDEAFTEAGLHSWSTESAWMGVGSGETYTSTQIRQLIRSMQAELVAMYPRDNTENATADWASVATYASQGISSGTAFDFEYYIDASNVGLDWTKFWGNSIFTERVDNRVAAVITTNHTNPWPEPAGNPCPTTSPDLRVGDGSYGPEDDFLGAGTLAATANAGTDFACAEVILFSPARGQYHQSNLQHIRYEYLGYEGEGLPGSIGTGQNPVFTRQMNDLLWAEGELRRTGGNLTAAATRINNSRVNRGGLTGVTAGSGQAALLNALRYEQLIEFMGQGADAYYNRRRMSPGCAPSTPVDACVSGNQFGNAITTDGLITGTPRHMPVPAKELDVLLRAVYTFGGSLAPKLVAGSDLVTVRDRWNELQTKARTEAFKRQMR